MPCAPRPSRLQPFPQGPRGTPPMGDGVLLGVGQLGHRPLLAVRYEHWVVAEAARPGALRRHRALARALEERLLAVRRDVRDHADVAQPAPRRDLLAEAG